MHYSTICKSILIVLLLLGALSAPVESSKVIFYNKQPQFCFRTINMFHSILFYYQQQQHLGLKLFNSNILLKLIKGFIFLSLAFIF